MNPKEPTQNGDLETQEITFIDNPVFSEIQTVEHPECTPNKMYDPMFSEIRIVVTVREIPDDCIPFEIFDERNTCYFTPFDILNEPLYTWPDEN